MGASRLGRRPFPAVPRRNHGAHGSCPRRGARRNRGRIAGPDASLGRASRRSAIFAAAYMLVIAEEATQLRKSKPVVVAAGLLWMLVALVVCPGWGARAAEKPAPCLARIRRAAAVPAGRDDLRQRARGAPRVRRACARWLMRAGFGYRTLFWLTGALAFLLSPVADNLTTALVMGAVVMAVGGGSAAFVVAGLHQHRRRRQCRRRVQPVRRHHDTDGVAEGSCRVRRFLPAVPAVGGQFRWCRRR